MLIAAVLLLGRDYLREHALPCATVEQIVAATGASRSRAYELRDAVREALPSLLRPVGRPPAPPREGDPDAAYALRGAITTFTMNHPGCVYGGAARRRYDDTFRRFVLDLHDQHADVDLERFADAIMVPLGTVKTWLAGGVLPSAAPPAPVSSCTRKSTTSLCRALSPGHGRFASAIRCGTRRRWAR